MDQIQFIFFDLDGTFLDDRKEMNEECIDYLRDLKRRKHIHYGFSTGRHIVSIAPYLDQYRLRDFFDGVVCNSGSDIFRFDPPVHTKFNYLTPDTLNFLLSTFQNFEFITVAFHNQGRLIATGMNREVQSLLDRNAYKRFYYPEDCEIQEAPKCLLLFNPMDQKKVEQALASCSLPGLCTVFTEPNICEVLMAGNSKAAGVKEFLQQYQLSLQNIMVFGDAENDKEIMKHSGISVCMKNGGYDVQALADYTTEKTNNENGIMDFLIKHESIF